MASTSEKSNKLHLGFAKGAAVSGNEMSSLSNTRGNENLLAIIAAAKEKKREEQKQIEFKKRCERAGKFIITVSVLMLMNVLMLVGGGFLFKHLESTNEIENCREQRTEYLAALNNANDLVVAKAAVIRGEKGITPQTKALLASNYKTFLRNFSVEVEKIGYNKFYNCSDLGVNATWTFGNSLVFSLTVITTIGYGVIVPKTDSGKIICIIYAVIGIPIYMVTLASIGDVLANLFKKFYWVACCCGCCKKTQELDTECEEEQDFKVSAAKNQNMRLDDEESNNDGSSEQCQKENNVTIPLIITISALFGFIVLGAVIFDSWERHLGFLDSLYFSFVTVSTIGFGDVVPHLDLEDRAGVGKLVTVIIYMTVGMATISMCFQLMADEIVAKFAWLGSKCGLSKKSSSDDDEIEGPNSADASKKLTRQVSMISGHTARRMSRGNLLRRSGTRVNLIKGRSPATPRKSVGTLASPAISRRVSNLVKESTI